MWLQDSGGLDGELPRSDHRGSGLLGESGGRRSWGNRVRPGLRMPCSGSPWPTAALLEALEACDGTCSFVTFGKLRKTAGGPGLEPALPPHPAPRAEQGGQTPFRVHRRAAFTRSLCWLGPVPCSPHGANPSGTALGLEG